MGVNSLPAPQSSTLTTRLPSHPATFFVLPVIAMFYGDAYMFMAMHIRLICAIKFYLLTYLAPMVEPPMYMCNQIRQWYWSA